MFELVSTRTGRLYLSGAETAPFGKSGGSVQLEEVSAGEAAFLIEVVADGVVGGGASLETSRAAEPKHRPLAPSERLMRILTSIVPSTAALLPAALASLLQGGTIGS